MKNESWVQTLKDYVMLTVGTLLIAIGVYFFKFPNHFSTGGVSGISIILAHYAPNLSAGAFVFIINMALLALGFAVFGRSFGVRTAYTSLVLSCATWGLEYIVPMDAPMTSQPLLELIFAVGLPAVGSAILFNMQASSGGTDIVAMIQAPHQRQYRQLSPVRGLFDYGGGLCGFRHGNRSVQHAGPGAEIRDCGHGAGKHQGA